MVALLPLLYGCAINAEAAREEAKRTADGSEKRHENKRDNANSSQQSGREMQLTITPGPIEIAPDLLPEAPEERPTPAPKKQEKKENPAHTWHPPLLVPQTMTVVDGERTYTVPVFPGATITLRTGEQHSEESATSSSSELTTEDAWRAVRNAPKQLWIIGGIGLLLSIVPLFLPGYRWLCPVIAGGTVAATGVWLLLYTHGSVLAYVVAGVIALCGVAGVLIVWLILRGKLSMQSALLDVVGGVELAKEAMQKAAAQTADATATATFNQSRELLKTSLGVEENDSTKALIARIRATGQA